MISIVVPTYREAENLPLVAQAVEESLAGPGHDYAYKLHLGGEP
jgi:hypothetical protein